MQRNICADCKYYAINSKDLSKGSCHFSPPVQFAMPTPQGLHITSQWPTVMQQSKACSEFQPEIEMTN